MKEMSLTQNKIALVDDEDYENLNKYKWCANKIHNVWYAERSTSTNGIVEIKLMHREIMGLKYKDGKQTDHKDGNGINNQKYNLRFCSPSENSINQRPSKHSSKYKGVFWSKNAKKWTAQIKKIHLGYFDIEEDAARAYDKKAVELFGEFARTNFNEKVM